MTTDITAPRLRVVCLSDVPAASIPTPPPGADPVWLEAEAVIPAPGWSWGM